MARTGAQVGTPLRLGQDHAVPGATLEYFDERINTHQLTAELTKRAAEGWRPIAFIQTGDSDSPVRVIFERPIESR